MAGAIIFPLCAAVQLALLGWAAAFGLRTRLPLREVLPLMLLAGGNAGWMLTLWGGQ